MGTTASLNARLFIHTQHEILWPQRLTFPLASVEIQNRTRLLGEQRIAREKPGFVLPWLNRRFMQHPPNRAPTDLFAERCLASSHQVAEGLTTERFSGFGDQFTGQGLDQSTIQWGKKWAYARGQEDPQWRSRQRPIGFATVGLVAMTAQRLWQPPGLSDPLVGAKATRAESVARLEREAFVGEPHREPLAQNRLESYKTLSVVLALRLPTRRDFYGELASF
jgi:hypothetical protein